MRHGKKSELQFMMSLTHLSCNILQDIFGVQILSMKTLCYRNTKRMIDYFAGTTCFVNFNRLMTIVFCGTCYLIIVPN